MDDKARDRRLQKLYGITAVEYDQRLAQQGGVCQICGRPPKKLALNVDHDHRWKYVAVTTVQNGDCWEAAAQYRGFWCRAFMSKRNDAIRAVKAQLKTASVRGLVCHRCNRGLQFFGDDPNRLARASGYLRSFQYEFLDLAP